MGLIYRVPSSLERTWRLEWYRLCKASESSVICFNLVFFYTPPARHVSFPVRLFSLPLSVVGRCSQALEKCFQELQKTVNLSGVLLRQESDAGCLMFTTVSIVWQ